MPRTTIRTEKGKFSNGQSLTIGRSQTSDFVTPMSHDKVSRVHAQIQITSKGKIMVQDMNSFNGTFVNRRRIKGGPIKLNPLFDELLLGVDLLDFREIGEDEYVLVFRARGHRI